MRIPVLFKELQYVGRAEGDRSTYHVFKGGLGYLVVAPNNRGGLNVNVVNLDIPEIIARKFGARRSRAQCSQSGVAGLTSFGCLSCP